MKRIIQIYVSCMLVLLACIVGYARHIEANDTYHQQADEYWSQAEEFYEQGDYLKAAELYEKSMSPLQKVKNLENY